jgi:hypothetical protein
MNAPSSLSLGFLRKRAATRFSVPLRVVTQLGEFPVTVTTLDLSQPWASLTEALRRDLAF